MPYAPMPAAANCPWPALCAVHPTSELPLQALILQAAGAALLARKGGYRGVPGAIGVAATAGSLAGPARLHREAGVLWGRS